MGELRKEINGNENIFYNGYVLENWNETYRGRELDKKLLLFKFNNEKYLFAPKWTDINEMVEEMIRVEDSNFAMKQGTGSYSIWFQDFLKVILNYMKHNPKFLGERVFNELRDTLNTIEKLSPKREDKEVVQLVTSTKPEIIQLEKSEFEKIRKILDNKRNTRHPLDLKGIK